MKRLNLFTKYKPDRKIDFSEGWDVFVFTMIISIIYLALFSNYNGQGDPCGCATIIFSISYVIAITYISVKHMQKTGRFCIEEKQKNKLFKEKSKTPDSQISDIVSKFSKPAFRDLAIFTIIYNGALFLVHYYSGFWKSFFIIALSVFMGQLTFLLAIIIISIWESFISIVPEHVNSTITSRIFLHFLAQIAWTFLSYNFVMDALIQPWAQSLESLPDNWKTAAFLQISAFYFVMAYFYYHRKISERIARIP